MAKKKSSRRAAGRGAGSTAKGRTRGGRRTGARSTGEQHEQGLLGILLNGLRDLYDAEQRLVDFLPEVESGAGDTTLRESIGSHLEETRSHAARLEEIFSELNTPARRRKCPAITGLITEAKELVGEHDEGPVRDAAIICAAAKIEHYEMASYESLLQIARLLSPGRIVELLEATLDEETAAAEKLAALAESTVNPAAMDQTPAHRGAQPDGNEDA